MPKKVFIGVGHGGADPGAVSGSFVEADINLTMALAAKTELERYGLTVGISRTKDENDTLTEEIKECNAFAPDVAIEVHNNAGGGDGFEVYVQTGAHATNSKKLATLIEKRVKATGQNSRGIKTKLNNAGKDWFGWLRQVNYPTVLIEGFFVDNVKDRADYDSVAEQKKMGVAYAHGVLDYLGIAVKKATTSVSATSNKIYRVQVGAFAHKPNADAMVKKLKAAGFTDAFISETTK